MLPQKILDPVQTKTLLTINTLFKWCKTPREHALDIKIQQELKTMEQLKPSPLLIIKYSLSIGQWVVLLASATNNQQRYLCNALMKTPSTPRVEKRVEEMEVFVERVLKFFNVNFPKADEKKSIDLSKSVKLSKGHFDKIELWLKKGGNPTISEAGKTSLFHTAVIDGNTDLVQLLLTYMTQHKQLGHINEIIPNTRKRALFIAIFYRQIKIIELLLKHQADLNLLDEMMHKTPLELAIDLGNLEVIRTILINCPDAKKLLNTVIKDKDTVLFSALASTPPNINIVNLLLENGADASIGDNENVTPLHIAAQNGDTKIVAALLNSKKEDAKALKTFINQTTKERSTPLLTATHEGHRTIVQLLLENGADTSIGDSKNITPLHIAAHNGYTEIVAVLLNSKADASIRNNEHFTPLHFAAQNGHTEIVAALLNSKKEDAKALKTFINQSTKERITPLVIAIHKGHSSIVQLLLESGADASIGNAESATPLHFAAQNGHTEIVAMLLDSKKEDAKALKTFINQLTKERITPLRLATHKRNHEVVQLLLTWGADASIENTEGETPLHFSAQNGHTEIVAMLLNSKKEDAKALKTFINQSTKEGVTPLSLASEKGHRDVVHLLLRSGADASIGNTKDETPLHFAAQNGHTEVVTALLDSKREDAEALKTFINQPTKERFTALSLAIWNGHITTVRSLLVNGAIPNIYGIDGTPYDILSMAIIKNNVGLIKTIFEILPNFFDSSFLKSVSYLALAIRQQNLEIIRLLCKHEKRPNVDLLDAMVILGQTDSLAILLAPENFKESSEPFITDEEITSLEALANKSEIPNSNIIAILRGCRDAVIHPLKSKKALAAQVSECKVVIEPAVAPQAEPASESESEKKQRTKKKKKKSKNKKSVKNLSDSPSTQPQQLEGPPTAIPSSSPALFIEDKAIPQDLIQDKIHMALERYKKHPEILTSVRQWIQTQEKITQAISETMTIYSAAKEQRLKHRRYSTSLFSTLDDQKNLTPPSELDEKSKFSLLKEMGYYPINISSSPTKQRIIYAFIDPKLHIINQHYKKAVLTYLQGRDCHTLMRNPDSQGIKYLSPQNCYEVSLKGYDDRLTADGSIRPNEVTLKGKPIKLEVITFKNCYNHAQLKHYSRSL